MSYIMINSINTLPFNELDGGVSRITGYETLNMSYGNLDRFKYSNFMLLNISAHKYVQGQDFFNYMIAKNFVYVDRNKFRKILSELNIYCDDMRSLNAIFKAEYGARYVGYEYHWDWSNTNSTAEYNYFFVIKNKKKFNYARLKFDF